MTEDRRGGEWVGGCQAYCEQQVEVYPCLPCLCDFHIILSLHSTPLPFPTLEEQHTLGIYYSFIFLAFIDERICTHPGMLFAGSL